MRNRWVIIFLILLVAGAAVYYYYFYSIGPQANGMSYGPAISYDGSRVAFHSDADNLVPNDDNDVPDVFLKDIESDTMELISQSSEGEAGNAGSYNASVDEKGKLVAFVSDASNLVPDDDNTCEEAGKRFNCPDVFVKDTASREVVRVSTTSDGEQANWKSESARIAADGRYVAFSSFASNLVPGDTSTCSGGQSERSCSDIFLKDLDTGAVVLISSSASGESGNGDSFGPSLSADGRYVAFHSRADNLVPDDTNNAPDVFVKDTEDGSIERVSEIAKDIGGNSDSYNAVISDKGDKVAFISAADNLKAGDANGKEDIFVSDLQTGVIKLVSLSASGIVANGNSTRPAMAPDGDSVAFDTLATSLVADDSAKCGESDEAASCSDILLKNLLVDTIMLISSDNDGAQGNWNSYSPSLSADGQMVAFVSEASNLVRGDGDACSDENSTWNCSDIYLKDLDSGKIDKISIPANE